MKEMIIKDKCINCGRVVRYVAPKCANVVCSEECVKEQFSKARK